MSVRPMMWHIFNKYNEPLCWDEPAIEFSTREAAERFLHSAIDPMYDSFDQYCEEYGVEIRECIFYYDYGYIDCSNKIVIYDDECEARLVECE